MSFDDVSTEWAISHLQLLAKKHPLKGPDLQKAKACMTILREAGYTNQEISELTNGDWSEPTIKLYSRGTEIKDSTTKHATLNLLAEFVRDGLGLGDLQSLLSLKRDLDTSRLKVGEVSLLLREAARVGIDTQSLVLVFEDLKRIMPEATIDDLSSVVSFKDRLKGLGIGSSELEQIVKAVESYGNLNEVLRSLGTFGSIKSIEENIAKLLSQRDELDSRMKGLQSDINDLENKKEGLRRSLEEYEHLRSLGFDHSVFLALKETCKRFGKSTTDALEAVNTYSNLIDLQLKVEEVQEEQKEEETRLKATKQENIRLQSVMEICNMLLFDLSYTSSTIRELHELAKKYGRPEDVYNALGSYGDLKRIQGQIEDLLEKRASLESHVTELKIQLEGLRGHADSIKESARSSLQPLSAELTKMVQNGFEKITSVYTQQYATIKKEIEDYGKKFAEAKILEEELNIARVVNSIIKYPTEAKNLPVGYPILFLDAVEKYCWAKGLNPQLSLKDASITDSPVYPHEQVSLHKLLYGAKTALLRGYEQVRH